MTFEEEMINYQKNMMDFGNFDKTKEPIDQEAVPMVPTAPSDGYGLKDVKSAWLINKDGEEIMELTPISSRFVVME